MTVPRYSILLVEDNPGDARLIGELLRETHTFSVDLAWVERVAAATELMATSSPDVVLVDLALPDSSGLETLRRIRDARAVPPVIIVLSGSGDESAVIAAVQNGAQDYLVKGEVTPRMLARSIRYAIERGRAEAKIRSLNDELEKRVLERTAQLLEANVALEHEVRERTDAEAELRRSAAEIEDLYDNAPCGYHSIDADGVFMRINQTELTWLGYERDEIVGRMRFSDLLVPADVPVFREVFRTFKERGSVTDLEYDLVRKNGTILPVLLNATAIRDSSGQYLISRSTMFDRTDRKRLEHQLAHAQKMEMIGRLAGGIAHDFNNLLTVIVGHADLCTDRRPIDAQARQHIEQIRMAAQRAFALTRQLLAFSRRQVIETKVFDLNDLIQQLEAMLNRLIRENIELVSERQKDLWNVKSDPGQIEQLVVNLVVNARDAMPDGGQLSIRTANVVLDERSASRYETVHPGEHVLLSVTDTGTGMDDVVKSHIFEPFFTTKEQGKGTGLGLATCYGIVRQCGGGIICTSAPGRGTTFEVVLPRAHETIVETTYEPDAPPPSGTETILVVEDDPQLRTLAVHTLTLRGYQVLEARNGQHALRVAKEHEGAIDLVITDVVMPVMGGLELADRLRADGANPKILFASGYYDSSAAAAAGHVLAGTLLAKPFTPADLARRVREMLDAPS